MIAGDVAVSEVDGDLFITESGDASDETQQVEVFQLKGCKVRVPGLGKTAIGIAQSGASGDLLYLTQT